MIATTTKNINNIEKLLEMGADPDLKDINDNTAINYSILSVLPNKYENFGIPNNTYHPKYCWNHKTYTNIPLNSYERRHGIINPVNLIQFSNIG